MKLNEVVDGNVYPRKTQSNYGPELPTFEIYLVAPDQYAERYPDDASAEVQLEVDVDVPSTEYEGPHMFAAGDVEVLEVSTLDLVTFMGRTLPGGSPLPPAWFPYVDFSQKDITAMGGVPTPGMERTKLDNMYITFVKNRIKDQVNIPSEQYARQM
jgi:hypothetical protein